MRPYDPIGIQCFNPKDQRKPVLEDCQDVMEEMPFETIPKIFGNSSASAGDVGLPKKFQNSMLRTQRILGSLMLTIYDCRTEKMWYCCGCSWRYIRLCNLG